MKTQIIIFFAFSIFILIKVDRTNGAIVYTDIQDTTIYVPDSASLSNSFAIDLNNDGADDFLIHAKYYLSWQGNHPPYDSYKISILSEGDNELSPGPVFEGQMIDNTLNYFSNFLLYGKEPHLGFLGPWPSANPDTDQYAFIGTKTMINGNFFYGWIKVKIDLYSFTILGYAINDVANQTITTGQTN